jgi:reversibly glycosylated polypeptide
MAKQIETAIVCTTIFEPAWLAGYLENLRAHGRDQDTAMIIIIDRKTPPTVAEAAAKARAQGYDVRLPSLDEQVEYLARLGAPADWVPWNTDNRRNIGFLMALESGAQRLISIDDDNYCLPGDDFVGSHAVVGQPAGAVPLARGATWFNICGMLGMDTKATVHARGFPYAARRGEHAKLTPASKVPAVEKKRRVAINAGLWLSDPDVDAATRLTMRPDAQKVAVPAALMGPEVWTPINTQNTGLIREAVFAYYYVRMGYPLQGLRIDRFGDILSGYFVQKVAKHLGDAIRLGAPVAEHRRSPHNLFKDLYFELAGMVIVEEMLPWLIELKLEGSDYAGAYRSLADAIAASASGYKGFIWDEGGREFLLDTARCMHTWLDVVRRFK